MAQLEDSVAEWDGLHDAHGYPTNPLMYDRVRQALALAQREPIAVTLMLFAWEPLRDEPMLPAAEVLHRIHGSVRASDTAGHLGSRVALLLPNANDADVPLVAGRLMIRMMEPFMLAGRPVMARASAGLAVAQNGDSVPTPEELFARSELALADAIERGGGFAGHSSAESQAFLESMTPTA